MSDQDHTVNLGNRLHDGGDISEILRRIDTASDLQTRFDANAIDDLTTLKAQRRS